MCIFISFDSVSSGIILFVTIYSLLFIGQLPADKLKRLTRDIVIFGVLFSVFIAITPNKILLPTEPIKLSPPYIKPLTIDIKKYTTRYVTAKNRIFRMLDIPVDYLAVYLFGIAPETGNSDGNLEDKSPLGDNNRQMTMAKVAITRGGLIGVFPGNSRQRDFLPQSYSDCIYAIIWEEMGFVGGITVLVLYVILFIRAGRIARQCNLMFPKLLVMGSSLIIFIQALVNMAMTVNLIPVTGQTLPLISRGINSMLVSCIFIGIILSVSQFENKKVVRMEDQTKQDSKSQEM
jgi:cell division protein FtsW